MIYSFITVQTTYTNVHIDANLQCGNQITLQCNIYVTAKKNIKMIYHFTYIYG